MKSVLVFTLPDDQYELDTCMSAAAYRAALSEFYNTSIRARRKYGELGESQRELLEQMAAEFADAVEGLEL